MNDKDYMRRAIFLARKGEGWVNPNPLVGAVIVKDGRIIGEGYHHKYGELHAERDALASLTESARGAEMYVTLEPCAMCASAIMLAKVGRVYIGCLSPKTGAVISNLHIYKRTICNHVPDVYYCIMEEECKALLRGFFRDV